MGSFLGLFNPVSVVGETPWRLLALLFGLALAVSSVGFFRLVYFISVGYAFSIGTMAAVLLWMQYQSLDLWGFAQNLILALWGLRLGIYLLRRELATSFQHVKAQTEEQYKADLKRKFFVWIGVSLLYVAMYSPALFSVIHASEVSFGSSGLVQIVGLVIMAAGLVIETAADKQKSDFKKKNPKAFVNVGLYRWVRYPNYLGEIMVWMGSWAMGLPFYAHIAEAIISLIGVVCIVLIMLGSTKRLEFSQDERYGSLEAYQQYVCSVPVLFPFIPIYSLKKVRVYLE